MREAMLTVSPKRQYLGIACPTTPAYATCVATIINFAVIFEHYEYVYILKKDARLLEKRANDES